MSTLFTKSSRSSNVISIVTSLLAILIMVSLPTLVIVGYVKNILWTFAQTSLVDLALGIFGAVMAPVGVIHGLWLLF